MEEFERTALLFGEDALSKLNKSSVLLFGVGGVGGFIAEALIRSGVGKLTVVDNDVISPSNINRQIIALNSTVGKDKVSVIKDRLKDINPKAEITAIKKFFLSGEDISFSGYNYVVDAIDTVTAKIEIIKTAKEKNIPVISCMGTGKKGEPLKLKIADISETHTCPLAKAVRRELKKLGIESGVKTCFSTEQPKKDGEDYDRKSKIIPSAIFVPATAGLLIAREVVKDLTK